MAATLHIVWDTFLAKKCSSNNMLPVNVWICWMISFVRNACAFASLGLRGDGAHGNFRSNNTPPPPPPVRGALFTRSGERHKSGIKGNWQTGPLGPRKCLADIEQQGNDKLARTSRAPKRGKIEPTGNHKLARSGRSPRGGGVPNWAERQMVTGPSGERSLTVKY